MRPKRWKRYVQAHPLLRDLAPAFPRIVHKIYRPYLSNHLSRRGRVAALMSHYAAIGETGLGQMVRRAALAPVTLVEFRGKSGSALSLRLSALRIALGGLQGLRADDGAAVIRQLTRELHGYRPKNFMVAALRQLGGSLGCDKLVLVSNRNRIVVNWRLTARISSDYDSTWRARPGPPRRGVTEQQK